MGAVDLGERYYQLSMLGRVTFVEAVAPGALVTHPAATTPTKARFARGTDHSALHKDAPWASAAASNEGGIESANSQAATLAPPRAAEPLTLHIIPLCKKLGTPFVDLITVGRTVGNDILLSNASVSRFQAFFRQRLGQWYLCDAGSRNGTKVSGDRLAPRTEALVQSRDILQFGSVELTFYTADSLFDLLAHGL